MVSAAEKSVIWNLPDGATLSWRTWGDETVLFNGASGQTHLIDAFSEQILRELEKSPLSAGALIDRLAQETGLDTELVSTRVREVLDQFDKQGLAEPG